MRTPVLVLAWFLLAGDGFDGQKAADIVHWSLSPGAVSVSPQGTARVTLTAEIEDGWHLYAIDQPKDGPPPLAIATRASQPFEIRMRDIEAPPPVIAQDPNFNTETRYWEGHVALVVPIAPRTSARVGTHRLPMDVTFQVCSSRMCLRPFTQTLFLDATIRGGTAKGTPR